MARLLDNWLESYLRYVEETEPAKIFQKWVGFGVLSAALRRKVYLSLGRLEIFPNIYVVLVAEAGVARKTQAIKFGLEFLEAIPEITIAADATTKEALSDCIELCAVEDIMPDGSIVKHSSLNVISREFESFLGQKKENTKMIVFLTDMFDCPKNWQYKTKHSGTNTIPLAYLSLQAATTPESLASSLPVSAIGGGLTSRIIFVWADKKYKKVPQPILTEEEIKLQDKLRKDLFIISRMGGKYVMTSETSQKWNDWYESYEEQDPNRICKDPSFNGWYSRKPTYALKIAMLCAASKSSNMNLNWTDIEEALEHLKEIEETMGYVFSAIGRSSITTEVDQVVKIIEQRKVISEKNLLSATWRDMDAFKFDNIINTIIRSGKAVRKYVGPKGETGEIWYYTPTYWRKLEEEKKR